MSSSDVYVFSRLPDGSSTLFAPDQVRGISYDDVRAWLAEFDATHGNTHARVPCEATCPIYLEEFVKADEVTQFHYQLM